MAESRRGDEAGAPEGTGDTRELLSAADVTEFSGAVNKVKGDDNDTCNALTNGQAAYGVYDLLDSFGTSDFDRIRSEHFTAESSV